MSTSRYVPRHAALPCGAGVSFKPEHFDDLMADPDAPDFIEVHAENYMVDGGPRHAQLAALAERVPLSIHGVGLSLGGSHPPDPAHLERLARLVDRYRPAAVSEHLAWSVYGGTFFGDLFPVPYTPEALARIAGHIDLVQQRLGRPLLIENPSLYLGHEESSLRETEFLSELVVRTGCRLLLDINNVVVSAHNLGYDPYAYMASYPLHAVREIHLAGHTVETLGNGSTLLIDDHGSPIGRGSWSLYQWVFARIGPVATLVEWDTNVPTYATLNQQMQRARRELAVMRMPLVARLA
jgi:uncharacterized protein (UPF0276 family)